MIRHQFYKDTLSLPGQQQRSIWYVLPCHNCPVLCISNCENNTVPFGNIVYGNLIGLKCFNFHQKIEDLVVNECKKYLTKENIQKIAQEMIAIAENSKSSKQIRYYKSSIAQRKRDIQGLMNALKVCDDDSTRQDIFTEIRQIKAEIQEIENELVVAETKIFMVTEEQIATRLMKIADGDITNLVYRRSLIRIFVNKILIYDDRITITFKTGDDEVVITRELLDKIERGLGDETLCFSEKLVHHEINPDAFASGLFHIPEPVRASKGR